MNIDNNHFESSDILSGTLYDDKDTTDGTRNHYDVKGTTDGTSNHLAPPVLSVHINTGATTPVQKEGILEWNMPHIQVDSSNSPVANFIRKSQKEKDYRRKQTKKKKAAKKSKRKGK